MHVEDNDKSIKQLGEVPGPGQLCGLLFTELILWRQNLIASSFHSIFPLTFFLERLKGVSGGGAHLPITQLIRV